MKGQAGGGRSVVGELEGVAGTVLGAASEVMLVDMGEFAEFAEGDSLEKASRNYSVGVDIITVYRDRPAFDFVDA